MDFYFCLFFELIAFCANQKKSLSLQDVAKINIRKILEIFIHKHMNYLLLIPFNTHLYLSSRHVSTWTPQGDFPLVYFFFIMAFKSLSITNTWAKKKWFPFIQSVMNSKLISVPFKVSSKKTSSVIIATCQSHAKETSNERYINFPRHLRRIYWHDNLKQGDARLSHNRLLSLI